MTEGLFSFIKKGVVFLSLMKNKGVLMVILSCERGVALENYKEKVYT